MYFVIGRPLKNWEMTAVEVRVRSATWPYRAGVEAVRATLSALRSDTTALGEVPAVPHRNRRKLAIPETQHAAITELVANRAHLIGGPDAVAAPVGAWTASGPRPYTPRRLDIQLYGRLRLPDVAVDMLPAHNIPRSLVGVEVVLKCTELSRLSTRAAMALLAEVMIERRADAVLVVEAPENARSALEEAAAETGVAEQVRVAPAARFLAAAV